MMCNLIIILCLVNKIFHGLVSQPLPMTLMSPSIRISTQITTMVITIMEITIKPSQILTNTMMILMDSISNMTITDKTTKMISIIITKIHNTMRIIHTKKIMKLGTMIPTTITNHKPITMTQLNIMVVM